MITWIVAAALIAIPIAGWWAAANNAKKEQHARVLAQRDAEGYAAANAGLAERLKTAEKQADYFRSVLGDHPSLRRVK